MPRVMQAAGRVPFTLEDQDNLAQFLAKLPSASRTTPSTHKQMAEHFPTHTWQSWMDHYKRTGRDVVEAKIKLILRAQGDRRMAKQAEKQPSGPKASGSRPSAAEELEEAASSSSEDEDSRPAKGGTTGTIRKVAYTQEDYKMLVEAVIELRRAGGTKKDMYHALARECPLHSALSWQSYHSSYRKSVDAYVEEKLLQDRKKKEQRTMERRAKAEVAAEAAVKTGKGKQRELEPDEAPRVPFTEADDELLVSKAAGAQVDGRLQSTVFRFLGTVHPHHSEKEWKKRWSDNSAELAVKVAAMVIAVTLARKSKRDAGAASPGPFPSKKSVSAPKAFHDPSVVLSRELERSERVLEFTLGATHATPMEGRGVEMKKEVLEIEEESEMDDDEIDELEDDSIPSVFAPSTASTSQSQRQLRLETAAAEASAAAAASALAPVPHHAAHRAPPFPTPTPMLPLPNPALLPPPHLSPADPSPPTPNATPPRSFSNSQPHGPEADVEDDREVIEATPDPSPVGDEMEVDVEVPSPFLRDGATYILPKPEEEEEGEEEGSIDDRRIESQLIGSALGSGWDPLDASEQALLRNYNATVGILERREEEQKAEEAREMRRREKKKAVEEEARLARVAEQALVNRKAREWKEQEIAKAAKEKDVARQIAEARKWASEIAQSKARKLDEAARLDRLAQVQAEARRLEERRQRQNADIAQAAVVAEAKASKERANELEREAAEMLAIIDMKALLQARTDELQRRHAEAAAKEEERLKTASSPLVSHKRRHVELEGPKVKPDEDDHRDKKGRISKRPVASPAVARRPPGYPVPQQSREAPQFLSPVAAPSVPFFLPADDSSSPRDAQIKPRVPTSALAARAALSNRSSRVLSPASIPLPSSPAVASSPDVKPRAPFNSVPLIAPTSSPHKPIVDPPSFVVPRHSTSSVTPAPILHTLPATAGPSLRDILVGYAQEYGLKRKQVINLYFSCSATTNFSILTSALQFFTSSPEILSRLPKAEEVALRNAIDRYVWRWEEDVICLGNDEERKKEVEVRKGRKSVAARVKFLRESGKETVESLGQKAWPW